MKTLNNKQQNIAEKIDNESVWRHWKDWHWQQKHAIKNISDFEHLTEIRFSDKDKIRLNKTAQKFPVSITPYYLSLIDFKEYQNDPIFKQCFPDPSELIMQSCDMEDPLAEEKDSPAPQITHRYPDRVLFHVSNVCAMYCRHCTRKRKVGDVDSIPDKMEKIGHSIIQHGNENRRVYLMKLDKRDLKEIVPKIERLAWKKRYEKIFCKVPEWARERFENHHYRLKASIPRFYRGKENVYFMSKFLNPERMQVTTEDEKKIQANLKLAGVKAPAPLPKISSRYQIQKLNERQAEVLSHLYEKVYDSYPFPITEAAYLRQTMQSHIDYFGVFIDRTLVAASSSEKDISASNAEMTDFATLPRYRGEGLATALLVGMENEIRNQNIQTLYTIARALSAGMNITFARCGYHYSGTLINNTQISGHIESMNIWYKHISRENR